MQPHEFLIRSKKALARQGIFGRRASSLIEEWDDHLQSEIKILEKSGYSHDEAGRQACKVLGTPEPIATISAIQLGQSTWQGRRPWLSSVTIGLMLTIASTLTLGLSMIALAETESQFQPATMSVLLACFNWSPWLLGLGWLTWQAFAMPAGWKGFWIVAACVALMLTSPFFTFTPALTDSSSSNHSIGLGLLPLNAPIKLAITVAAAALFWLRATPSRRPIDVEQ